MDTRHSKITAKTCLYSRKPGVDHSPRPILGRYRYPVLYSTGKKTPGGAGTHTGHTGHTGARGHTDHTDEPHNHPLKSNSNDTPARKPRPTQQALSGSEGTAARTAASPESTAPRGRLLPVSTVKLYRGCTGRKTPGGAGHTREKRAHTGKRITPDEPHNHPLAVGSCLGS